MCPQALQEEIFLPFYSAYVRGQDKAVTVTVKLEQFTADKIEKGQFFRGNGRNLAKEGVVRKISRVMRKYF